MKNELNRIFVARYKNRATGSKKLGIYRRRKKVYKEAKAIRIKTQDI